MRTKTLIRAAVIPGPEHGCSERPGVERLLSLLLRLLELGLLVLVDLLNQGLLPWSGGRGATSETAEEFAPRSGTLAATGGSAAASAPSGPTAPGLAETEPRRKPSDQVQLRDEHSSGRACNPPDHKKSAGELHT